MVVDGIRYQPYLSNYGRWSANLVNQISKTPKGTSTHRKGCVCPKLKKSIHGLEFCSGNEMRNIRMQGGHPRRRQYP